MQGRLVSTLTIGSPAPSARMLREGSGSVSKTVATPKGFAATISAGSVTAAGHNITTGQKVAVFWTDATTGLPKRRYDVTAGTVAGNVVPVGSGGGAGDVLPTSGAIIISGVTTVNTLALTGSQMMQLLASCDQRGLCQLFSDAGTTSILVADATAAGEGVAWCQGGPIAAPFSASVAQVNAYNASTTTAATWTITALLI